MSGAMQWVPFHLTQLSRKLSSILLVIHFMFCAKCCIFFENNALLVMNKRKCVHLELCFSEPTDPFFPKGEFNISTCAPPEHSQSSIKSKRSRMEKLNPKDLPSKFPSVASYNGCHSNPWPYLGLLLNLSCEVMNKKQLHSTVFWDNTKKSQVWHCVCLCHRQSRCWFHQNKTTLTFFLTPHKKSDNHHVFWLWRSMSVQICTW